MSSLTLQVAKRSLDTCQPGTLPAEGITSVKTAAQNRGWAYAADFLCPPTQAQQGKNKLAWTSKGPAVASSVGWETDSILQVI